jgi:acetyltransferase-like isoleucine patch superfamily enzyme
MSALVTIWRALVGEVLQRLISVSAILFGLRADALQRVLLRLRGVQVSGPVYFGSGTHLFGAPRLSLGARVAVGERSVIVCHGPITIGEDFLAAPGLYLNSGGHEPRTLQAFAKPIHIGRRVWCGTRVTICAGVEIGDDVVIGAGAVVVTSIPAQSVAVGIPARVVNQLNREPGHFASWYVPPRRKRE